MWLSEVFWFSRLWRDRRRMWQQVEWTGGGTDFGGGDPQVACRRCQAAMAEQQLNGSDIGAGFKQMHSECVPKRMGCHRLG